MLARAMERDGNKTVEEDAKEQRESNSGRGTLTFQRFNMKKKKKVHDAMLFRSERLSKFINNGT